MQRNKIPFRCYFLGVKLGTKISLVVSWAWGGCGEKKNRDIDRRIQRFGSTCAISNSPKVAWVLPRKGRDKSDLNTTRLFKPKAFCIRPAIMEILFGEVNIALKTFISILRNWKIKIW